MSAGVAVAAALAALAGAALVGPSGRRLLTDRLGAPGKTEAGGAGWGARRRTRDDLPARSPPDARDVPLARPRRLVRRWRGVRPDSLAGTTREAYTVLSSELRAGRPAPDALGAAAAVAPALTPAARAARTGGDVPAALREAGAGGRALALAWDVGEQAGIGLAPVVDRVVDGIAADREIQREVAAQLAGPRATARMLACLPALGLLLGGGVGDPFAFLFGSRFGIGCLLAGAALAAGGLWWVERLARRVEE